MFVFGCEACLPALQNHPEAQVGGPAAAAAAAAARLLHQPHSWRHLQLESSLALAVHAHGCQPSVIHLLNQHTT